MEISPELILDIIRISPVFLFFWVAQMHISRNAYGDDDEKKVVRWKKAEHVNKYFAYYTIFTIVMNVVFWDTTNLDDLELLTMFMVLALMIFVGVGFISPYNRKRKIELEIIVKRIYPVGTDFADPDRWFRMGWMVLMPFVMYGMVAFAFSFILINIIPSWWMHIVLTTVVISYHVVRILVKKALLDIDSVQKYVRIDIFKFVENFERYLKESQMKYNTHWFTPPRKRFSGIDYVMIKFPDDVIFKINVGFDGQSCFELRPRVPETFEIIDKLTNSIDRLINQMKDSD